MGRQLRSTWHVAWPKETSSRDVSVWSRLDGGKSTSTAYTHRRFASADARRMRTWWTRRSGRDFDRDAELADRLAAIDELEGLRDRLLRWATLFNYFVQVQID
mmetsp:Transcript_2741/g.5875  ORF Transcript_2741/g.5875 Transcript_2741/m.5875 type:complete len:103 (-) Transcript_2741:294-602(-)